MDEERSPPYENVKKFYIDYFIEKMMQRWKPMKNFELFDDDILYYFINYSYGKFRKYGYIWRDSKNKLLELWIFIFFSTELKWGYNSSNIFIPHFVRFIRMDNKWVYYYQLCNFRVAFDFFAFFFIIKEGYSIFDVIDEFDLKIIRPNILSFENRGLVHKKIQQFSGEDLRMHLKSITKPT